MSFSFEGYTGALVKVTVVKGMKFHLIRWSVTLSLSSDNNDYSILYQSISLVFM